jgi:hypothetical protein
VIEVQTFRLIAGADEEEFRVADERLQTEFYYDQPGLIRRTTGRSADGLFVALVHWDSSDEAEAAAVSLVSAPSWVAIAPLIDPSTQGIQRFSAL